MAIAAELSLPSSPPLATDWAAVSVAAALETSNTTSTIVASAAVALTVANNADHPRDGHDVDDCLHDDGHDDVIIDDGLTSSCSPSVVRPVDRSNRRPCPSPGLMTTMTDDRKDDVEEEKHGLPSLTGVEAFAMMGGNN
jgi:hypothetical protein